MPHRVEEDADLTVAEIVRQLAETRAENARLAGQVGELRRIEELRGARAPNLTLERVHEQVRRGALDVRVLMDDEYHRSEIQAVRSGRQTAHDRNELRASLEFITGVVTGNRGLRQAREARQAERVPANAARQTPAPSAQPDGFEQVGSPSALEKDGGR